MTFSAIFLGLTVLAVLLTLISLIAGLLTFGGAASDSGFKGQFWMRLRVFFQGAALASFLVATLLG